MVKNGLETVRELAQMQQDLSVTVLHELRNGDNPDPRTRIDKIRSAYPQEYERGVYSNAGNSSFFILNDGGRRVEQSVSGTTIQYLGALGDTMRVAIYPYGLAGTTEARQPIFEDPEISKRVSVVLEYGDDEWNAHLLKRRVEPLYNIDQDGNVFARFTDQPTPTELGLLYSILDQFEEITQPQSQ